MDGAIVRTTLSLISPGILFVFGIAFVCAWLIERKRSYLLVLASACALFALGAISQILGWPPGAGPNAIVSGAIYTSAVLAAAEGILLRSGTRLGLRMDAAVLIGFTLLLAYFFYVDRNLLARVYIQNFGYGIILLVAAVRLSPLAGGRYVDRVLFWILLAFALHFFPRTLLTVGLSVPTDKTAFANSMFWQLLQLSLAVLGVGLALAILAAAVADVIDDLRRERDTDLLTGVLNRRGFEERSAAYLRNGGQGTASLVLCDVDNFKSINDAHGHDVGDNVLREVGRVLRKSSRKGDIVGRLGGEEFAVFLPDTSAEEAYECSERLRIAIENTSFSALAGARQLTASFGVGTFKSSDAWSSLYKRVDARLYEAKRTGRNRTIAQEFSRSKVDGETEMSAHTVRPVR
ncbi:GGDEF domain-containing protein [Mesorhizobium sp.]|uniref:GGDEF domain-containing protein n=1 Tax=Mesorhizobium sp. TaxID=1871066 RepID=UPI0012279A63|nr:GGDEF domain-containing protein [Mesorhizobium sp.]TIO34937.1 MAG: GGDEF domain-containing protein [Mesorhizobium sp.]